LYGFKLLSSIGIEATVLHCASVKPLDEELIVQAAKATGRVLTLEMGRTEGGFGSAVAETLVREHPTRMHIMGLERDQVFKSAPFADVMRYAGLTPMAVLEAAKKLIAVDKH
jgi:transketolase